LARVILFATAWLDLRATGRGAGNYLFAGPHASQQAGPDGQLPPLVELK
jgi:hypothetical protein